jgi:hypothetical protein
MLNKPLVILLFMLLSSNVFALPNDTQIAKDLIQPQNKAIIEEFLKYELKEVNSQVTQPLLPKHKSLVFFIKQADRGPLKNLLFLEDQIHKLLEAQKHINNLPYSLLFVGDQRTKILGLEKTAERIISYGIPLMKRDFFKVIIAAKEVADKRHKHPMELMPNAEFRDAVYRQIEPTAADLDREMGKLSEGELICISLGWVLEQVTVTSLWMKVNDNKLPDKDDYMLFRKKRSEHFEKRLKRIYGSDDQEKTASHKKPKAGSVRD